MATSQVRFTNSTTTKIYVAYMRRDYGCQFCGDVWDVLGWINLDPGETETRANATGNRWFYYYAERADSGIYSGPYPAEVRQSVFEKCTCLGVTPNPYHTVGFRVLDLDQFSGVNYT
jgi:hypothetical protein